MEKFESPFNKETVSVSGHEVKPIYPKIWASENKTLHTIEVKTFLRKKHTDGKYYLQEFYRKYRYELEKGCEAKDRLFELLNQMHVEVYNNLICSIIMPDLVTWENQKIFTLDDNQQEETERVQEYLKF